MSTSNGMESAPMKDSELGKYVCVVHPDPAAGGCLHSPHITIMSDGVWVKLPDSVNPGSFVYSSAHRDCYESWAVRQDAIRVDEQPNGLFHITRRDVTRTAGTRTDARAMADYLEARTPVDPELFRRTAPAWNCVDYPGDGMHYANSGGDCSWCGMTRAQIRTEHLEREERKASEIKPEHKLAD